jgi:NosR/NirI family transcriptional regulator, nitrous oxide reductase regulator
LGDRHRHKMPHGPGWNRLNLVGQLILALALAMLSLRILGWVQPGPDWAERTYRFFLPNYKWTVDVFLAGVIGIGLYFWYSGRVWCRFFCPLSALMNVYTRLGRFRIFAEKKKCISCGVCTAVCHQGIDVMAFAQRGLPMDDPQCVRCSACVQSCPTGVLSFGRLGEGGQPVPDTLLASPIHLQERAEPKR